MTRGRKKGSYSKWSPERVSQIVEMAKTGMSYSEIGATMGEKGYVIRNLLKRYGVYVTRKDVGQPRWRPIETAPKDQWVLTYDLKGVVPSNESRFVVAKWAYDDQWWYDVVLKRTDDEFENWSKEYLTCCPVYWMPLPKPPKE